jgi:hypothetical protein
MHVARELPARSVSVMPVEPVPLLKQALHPGPVFVFANHFTANSRTFHRMLRRRNAGLSGARRELLVRFFAYDRFLPEHYGNLKPLLDTTCAQLNRAWAQERMNLEQRASDCERAFEALR